MVWPFDKMRGAPAWGGAPTSFARRGGAARAAPETGQGALGCNRGAVTFNDRALHRGAADDRPSAVIRLGGMATGASRKIDITALGPAAVDTVLWQMQGRLHVTVVAKASFSFALDAAMDRVEPEEILRAEIHHNKNPMRSVRATGDLAPFQPLCDVVLTGHACAPQGTMV